MAYSGTIEEVRAKRNVSAARRRASASPEQRALWAERTRQWRAANKDYVRAKKRQWGTANPEKKRAHDRASYRKNKDKYRPPQPCFICGGPKPRGRGVLFCDPCAGKRRVERRAKNIRDWTERNRGRVNAKNALRHAIKLRATPAWLTKEQRQEIRDWYVLAAAVGWEVDHIVPLRGDIVSGLHVPWNLQLLPEAENIAKKNKLTAEAYL